MSSAVWINVAFPDSRKGAYLLVVASTEIDLLLQAVATVLKLGPGVVAERRAVHCNRILKRIKELEAEERVLHESLHPQVRSVFQGKRLLIWRELKVEAGYPDLEIFDEVTEGIKLVGPAHESQAFLAGMTPAQQSVSQSRSQALWRRKTSIGKCRTSGNTSADVELWEQSLNEVIDGWLDGPFYDETEMSERDPHDQVSSSQEETQYLLHPHS